MMFIHYYSHVLLKRYLRIRFSCNGRPPTRFFRDQAKRAMQFRWLLLVAILCLAAIDLTSSLNVWKLAKANGGFAFRLYNNITKGENGNVFFSPFRYNSFV